MTAIEESLEAKLPGLLEQFPRFDAQFIESVASADPTGCRCVAFMLKTLQENEWSPIAIGTVRDVLESFQAVKRDASWKGHTDINDYATLAQLVEDLNQHGTIPAATPVNEHVEGATQIASAGEFEVWQASTPQAASLLGRGKGGVESPSTRWPCQNTKLASKYLVSGPFYVVTKSGEAHVLVHFGRHEAKDTHNLNLSLSVAKEIALLFTGQSFASDLGKIPYKPGGWQLDDGDIAEYLKKLRSKFIAQRMHGFYKDETWHEPVSDVALLVRRWKAKEPEFRHLLKQAQGDRDLEVIMKAGRRHPEPTGMQALANAVYDLEHA